MFSCSSKTVANVRLSLGIHVLIAHKFIPLTWGSVPGNPALAGQTGEKLRSVHGNPALAGQTGRKLRSVHGNPALAGQTGEKLRSVHGNRGLAGQTGLLAGRFAAANQKDGESCDGQQ